MKPIRRVFRGIAVVCAVAHLGAAQDLGQYKWLVQNPVAAMARGQNDQAAAVIEEVFDQYPGDAEAFYLQAVLASAQGDSAAAMEAARQAISAGLPPGRFVAGPRGMLATLSRTIAFRSWMDSLDLRMVHGPMLGRIDEEGGAAFWLRTAEVADVRVTVSDHITGERVAEGTGRTLAESDYTATISVAGLEPAMRYVYRIEIDGRLEPDVWTFETPPAPGEHARLSVAFGGGAGYAPWHERMWHTILARNPLAFLFLGDNVYIDHPTLPDVQRYTYYRRQSRPEYRAFTGQTAIYATWDDHDFVDNDGWGGPAVDDPPWKRDVWDVFRQNWVNPAYGGGYDQPGSWLSFRLGDVEFFLLDSRYYREDPESSDAPSMLGSVQRAWLLEALGRSKATFKVLASPVPWASDTKPGSLDTWDGYAEERESIFSFIEENDVSGVILLSADRHRSDLWRIERLGSYDLFEFESSRLTNDHVHRIMPGSLFGYNEKCSFGLLTFDTTLEDPEVTYRIYSIDGELVFTFAVPLSRLTPP